MKTYRITYRYKQWWLINNKTNSYFACSNNLADIWSILDHYIRSKS